MKRAFLLAMLASLPLTASAAGRQRIAVLDIRAVQGVSAGTATILTAIAVDDAARGGYDVISQADVTALIGFEKQKQMLGCGEDSSCLAEIGGALGVEYVLSGQVGQIGSRFHLSFQILDAKKAKVVSRTARFSERDEDRLAEAAQQCVSDLLGAARQPARAPHALAATPPPAPVAAPQEPPPPVKAPAAVPPPPPLAPAARPDLAARPPVAQPPISRAPEHRGGWRPSRRAAWLTLGGGAALMAGGAFFGLRAAATKTELEDAWAHPDYQAIYDTKKNDADALARRSNVLWGAGAVTAGVGTWMFFKSRPAPLAVAPVVGDGQLGVVASGAF